MDLLTKIRKIFNSNDNLFITDSERKEYLFGEKINIEAFSNNGFQINKNLSVILLCNLIKKNSYYDIVEKLFNDCIAEIEIKHLSTNEENDYFLTLSKTDIVKGLNLIIRCGRAHFSDDELNKIKKLNDKVSMTNLFKSADNEYKLYINDREYTFKEELFLNFLKLDKDEYEKFFLPSDTLTEDEKRIFCYAFTKYFYDKDLTGNYLLPTYMVKRFHEIAKSEKIDIESFEKIKQRENNFMKFVKISDSLREKILSKMPNDLTALEKAMYIYIKMCKTLTYDDEYFVIGQKGLRAKKHQNVGHIMDITPDKNNVVCFEFNAIYAKFLEELGIEYEINSSLENRYGKGHANLFFKAGKYIVGADSVSTHLNNDLTRSKLNQPLIGLLCINSNIESRKSFFESLYKVYNLIVDELEEEKNRYPNSFFPKENERTTFENRVDSYKSLTSNIKPISLSQKIDILSHELNDSKIVGIDYISYMLQLKKFLFNEEELTSKINLVIIKNQDNTSKGKIITSSVVLTANEKGISDIDCTDNSYYLFDTKGGFRQCTKEEIEDNLKSGKYEYVDKNDHFIPGIKLKKAIRRKNAR